MTNAIFNIFRNAILPNTERITITNLGKFNQYCLYTNVAYDITLHKTCLKRKIFYKNAFQAVLTCICSLEIKQGEKMSWLYNSCTINLTDFRIPYLLEYFTHFSPFLWCQK